MVSNPRRDESTPVKEGNILELHVAVDSDPESTC